MGRGLRIVIGVIAGFAAAQIARALTADIPVIFFGSWLIVGVTVWFLTKPRSKTAG